MASFNRTVLHIFSAVAFAVFAYILRKLIKYLQSKKRVKGKDPVAVATGENSGTVETRGLLAKDKVYTRRKEETASEAEIKLDQENDMVVSGGTDAVVKLGETVEVIEEYIPEGESGQTSDDTGRSKENCVVVSGGTDAVVKSSTCFLARRNWKLWRDAFLIQLMEVVECDMFLTNGK
ncbi:unnamed protein product [Cylicocyclus nassatus]|uniref:Uncharacterized protein n=1 Tax=Cylicocyclus nassatus TaxID=53992 RepID=A0AA36DMH9_CYLNA|nr:unnamed protein product [Cylicocyclus nassatus]